MSESTFPAGTRITPTSATLPWKKYDAVIKESFQIVKDRKEGRLKSLKTRWKTFNSIGLSGIEWQSLYVIGARPGVGKTFVAATIARDLQELNTDQEFNVLHFQFEMLATNMGIRDLAAGTKMNVRYIQSAADDGMPKLTDMDLSRLGKYAENQSHRNEYIIDRAMTVEQMEKTIIDFYRFMGKKPIVITLDHTLLIKQAASESSRMQTLQNLAVMLTDMKNRYPVTFIILTQLNRSIDEAERQKPGMLSNFPTDADVYGSDFLMQCADVMIAYNRPAKYNLSVYGPMKYQIEKTDEFLLAMHVLKNRFGNLSIQWYRADYARMCLVEAPAPVCKAKFSH